MAYAILTPDGAHIHRVVLSDLPDGLSHAQLGVALVNLESPEGYHRTGWELVAGVVQPILAADVVPQPAPVPEQVSLKQFRKALRRRGVPPENIIAWINANITDPVARAEAIEDIEYSNVVERSNPFLSAMAAALGYDAAWVDETMILAASLQ